MHKILFICLLLPVLVGFSGLGRGNLELENRTRETFPQVPNALSALPRFFGEFDAFVSDNIGFRDQMITAKKSFDVAVNGYNDSKVISGKNGWMYYNFPGVLDRNNGREFNAYRVSNTVNYVVEAQELAIKNGAQFLAMPVPSKHSVYRKDLPRWAQVDALLKTEQRAIVEQIKGKGISVSDPYTLFQSYDLDKTPLYFRRDTHWNHYGSYIAFYDAMSQFGLQESLPTPDEILLGYSDAEYYGVLDQFLGLSSAAASEPIPNLNMEAFYGFPELSVQEFDDHVSMDTIEVKYAPERPKLLIVGDSFTYGFFRQYYGALFSEVRWSHHDYGAYARSGIADFKPDYVLFEFVDWEVPAWRAFEQ